MNLKKLIGINYQYANKNGFLNKRFIKFPLVILGLFLTVFFSVFLGINMSTSVLAGDTTKTYSSSYVVDEDGMMKATINIKLTHNVDTPSVLTYYDLYIGSVKPDNFVASMNGSPLQSLLVDNDVFLVRIFFDDIVLRKNEPVEFTASYELDEYVEYYAGSYEMSLPLFKSAEDSSFDYISLAYPESFGGVSFCNTQFDTAIKNGKVNVTFTDVSNISNISLTIGEERFYIFDKEIEIINTSEKYVKKDVILPPDTNNQQLLLSSINPYPDYAVKDVYGNYILSYNVAPGDSFWVHVSGYVISRAKSASEEELSVSLRDSYLDTTSQWFEIYDQDILGEFDNFKKSQPSQSEIVDWAYLYVIDRLNLSSDFKSLHGKEFRKGANIALQSYKDASAEDFADVFVGISRYFGVPSRVVAGYVFEVNASGQNVGSFHVWPQYWDEEYGWVSVDPAYEEFSGYNQRNLVGLNRVIYVVDTDAVASFSADEVTEDYVYTDQIVNSSSVLETDVNLSSSLESGVFESGILTLKNNGNTILSSIDIIPSFDNYSITLNNLSTEEILLPGDEISLEFNIKSDQWYMDSKKVVSFTVIAQSPNGTQRDVADTDVQFTPLSWAEPVAWLITVFFFIIFSVAVYFIYFYVNKLLARRNLRTIKPLTSGKEAENNNRDILRKEVSDFIRKS